MGASWLMMFSYTGLSGRHLTSNFYSRMLMHLGYGVLLHDTLQVQRIRCANIWHMALL